MAGLFGASTSQPGGKKAGSLALRCCRRLRVAGQSAGAITNPWVMMWLVILGLQLWWIRTLFSDGFRAAAPAFEGALKVWNETCAARAADVVIAASRGEIVDVGTREGRYFVVPRVCVSAFGGGAPWLPAAALSEAGRAQLAALAPPGTDGVILLPGVSVGFAVDGAAMLEPFRLLVREGTGDSLAAADGSASLAAAVLGTPGEAPAVVAAPPPPDGRAFSPAGYALAGAWLRLRRLHAPEPSFRPWLVPPFLAPAAGAPAPGDDRGALDALFRRGSLQSAEAAAAAPRCYGPALIGGAGRAGAPNEHALLREALLLRLSRQPATRGTRPRTRGISGGSAGGGRLLRVVVAGPSAPLTESAAAVVRAVGVRVRALLSRGAPLRRTPLSLSLPRRLR